MDEIYSKPRCAGELVNNLLQPVCEKVFQSWGGRGFVSDRMGLLSSRHLSGGAAAAVKKCANPSGAKDGIR